MKAVNAVLIVFLINLSLVFAEESETGNYIKGEIIVKFKEGVNKDNVSELVSSFGLSLKDYNPSFLNVAVVAVPVGSENSWIIKFQEHDIVEYAQLNRIYGIGPVTEEPECPVNCNCDDGGAVISCKATSKPSGRGSSGGSGGTYVEKKPEEERYESCDYPLIIANSFAYTNEDKIYFKIACNNGGYFIGDDIEIYITNEDYIPPSASVDLLKDYGSVIANLDDEFYDLVVKVDPSNFPKVFARSGAYRVYLCEEDCDRRYAGPFFKFLKRGDCPSSCSCDENSFYCGLDEPDYCKEANCIRTARGCSCWPSLDAELEKSKKFNSELEKPRK
ncbi:MAG: hypothetical protein AABX59_01260, partial [Nanoarchaeota archaeon]